MSQEAAMLPHEVIMSDRHWAAEPLGLPRVGGAAGFIDAKTDRWDLSLEQVINNIMTRMANGYDSRQLPAGEELPIPDQPGEVLKVVRDSKTWHIRFNPLANLGNVVDPETFDRLAAQMEAGKVYRGPAIKLRPEVGGTGRAVSVSRGVTYYRASSSRQQLAGIPSSRLDGRLLRSSMNEITPPLVVGATYAHSPRHISRIVLAEVLRPLENAHHVAKVATPRCYAPIPVRARQAALGLA